MLKQCICPDCGRVAEIRRQKNGQRLRYLYCVNGHGGLQSRKDAAKWAEIEQDHIGTVGQFPPKIEPKQDNPEPEPTVLNELPEITPTDWQPEPEDAPEANEIEPVKITKVEGHEKPAANDDALPLAVKVSLIAAASLFGLGGVIHIINKKKAA